MNNLPKPESKVTLKLPVSFRSIHTIIPCNNGFLASVEFDHKLIFFDLNGSFETVSDKLELTKAFRYPRGMLNVDGAVWLCDSWNNRIIIFQTMPGETQSIPVKLIEFPFFDEPSDLCQAGERIIVANKGNGTLCSLDLYGRVEWVFPIDTSIGGANAQRPFPPSVADAFKINERKIDLRRPCQVVSSPTGIAVIDRENCHFLSCAAQIDRSLPVTAGLYERNALYIGSSMLLLDDCKGSLLFMRDSGEPAVITGDSAIEACWSADGKFYCAHSDNQVDVYSCESISGLLETFGTEPQPSKDNSPLREILKSAIETDVTDPEIARHKYTVKEDSELRKLLFTNFQKLGEEKFAEISESLEAIASGNVLKDLISLAKPPDPMPIFKAYLAIADNVSFSDETNERLNRIRSAAETISLMHRMISLFFECEESAALAEILSKAAKQLHDKTRQGLQSLYGSLESSLSGTDDLAEMLRQHHTFTLLYGLYVQVRKFALMSIMFHDHIRGASSFSSQERRFEGSFLSPPTWQAVARRSESYDDFCEQLKKCINLYGKYKESLYPTHTEIRELIREQWLLMRSCNKTSDDTFFIPVPIISNPNALNPLLAAKGKSFSRTKAAPWADPDESLLLEIISEDQIAHTKARDTFINRYMAKPAGCTGFIKRLWMHDPALALDFTERLQELLLGSREHGWRPKDFAGLHNTLERLRKCTLSPESDEEEISSNFDEFFRQYFHLLLGRTNEHFARSLTFADNDIDTETIRPENLRSGELYQAVDAMESMQSIPPAEIFKWYLASNEVDTKEFNILWERLLLLATRKAPVEIKHLLNTIIYVLPKERLEQWLGNLRDYYFYSTEFISIMMLKSNKYDEPEETLAEIARLEEMTSTSEGLISQRLQLDSSLSENERQSLEEKLLALPHGRLHYQLYKGNSFFRNKDYRKCIDALSAIPDDERSHFAALLLKAQAHLYMCQHIDGLKLLKVTSFLYPFLTQAADFAGLVNLDIGDNKGLLHTLSTSIVKNLPSPLITSLGAIQCFRSGEEALAKRVFYNLQNLQLPVPYASWLNLHFAMCLFEDKTGDRYFEPLILDDNSAESFREESLMIFKEFEAESNQETAYQLLKSKYDKNKTNFYKAVYGNIAGVAGKHEDCFALIDETKSSIPALQLFKRYAEAGKQIGKQPDNIIIALSNMKKDVP